MYLCVSVSVFLCATYFLVKRWSRKWFPPPETHSVHIWKNSRFLFEFRNIYGFRWTKVYLSCSCYSNLEIFLVSRELKHIFQLKHIFRQIVMTKWVSTTGNPLCGHIKKKVRLNSNSNIFLVSCLQNGFPPPETHFSWNRGDKMGFHHRKPILWSYEKIASFYCNFEIFLVSG